MMGISSLNSKERRTIRKSECILGVQTANGVVEASTKASVRIKEPGIGLWIWLRNHLLYCRWADCVKNWDLLDLWPPGGTRKLTKGNKIIVRELDIICPFRCGDRTSSNSIPSTRLCWRER